MEDEVGVVGVDTVATPAVPISWVFGSWTVAVAMVWSAWAIVRAVVEILEVISVWLGRDDGTGDDADDCDSRFDGVIGTWDWFGTEGGIMW